ncbi:hypothetical protein FA95DRAFT_1480108 [Auriscalpium vulgare]|uniref:Uncharacterized protein n=1 Tax=Auriscalpium vulgare TaxID=40419 RepID=A0ACB8SCB4_9AGAM|nr:hypothetical protein FA95DRAFT_1480108 [Auriscalpium vulgare]
MPSASTAHDFSPKTRTGFFSFRKKPSPPQRDNSALSFVETRYLKGLRRGRFSVRDSWPLASIEKRLDSAIDQYPKNAFGLADVLSKFAVLNGAHSIPSEVKEPGLEGRIHVRAVMRQTGAPLTAAESPHALIRGVLHSMIGWWEFLQAGRLHRNVSLDNIILLSHGEFRQPVNDDIKKETEGFCYAMLLDGDQSTPWPLQTGAETEDRGSGTLPFVSERLLSKSINGQQAFVNPMDELSSFVWVLMWALFFIVRDKGALTKKGPIPLTMEVADTGNCMVEMYTYKSYIKQTFSTPKMLEDDFLRLWAPLVNKLLTIVEEGRSAFEEASVLQQADMKKNYVERCCDALLQALDQDEDSYIPNKWPGETAPPLGDAKVRHDTK